MSNSNSSLPIICNLCGLNFGQLIDNAALHFSGKSHQKKHYRNEENPEKEKCSVFLPGEIFLTFSLKSLNFEAISFFRL